MFPQIQVPVPRHLAQLPRRAARWRAETGRSTQLREGRLQDGQVSTPRLQFFLLQWSTLECKNWLESRPQGNTEALNYLKCGCGSINDYF